MTIRNDIINTQINCNAPLARQPILIFTPIAVIELLDINPKYYYLFDPTSYLPEDTIDYCYLRLFTQYSPETNKLGEGGLKPVFSGISATATTVQRGFKATIIQRERVIYEIIQQLILISESTRFNQFSPIKIIDFCNVEVGDRLLINDRLATVRYGEITIDNLSALSFDQDYLSDNWAISFTESRFRLK